MPRAGTDYERKLRFWQRGYFLDLMSKHRMNMSSVSRECGLERSYMYRLLTQLGINPRRYTVQQREAGRASQVKQREQRQYEVRV